MASALQIALAQTSPDFIAGADFSHLAFFESRGAIYRTDGQTQDGFAILRRSGLNCVRLRLFTSSATQAQRDPYNYANNLDYTLPLAVRARNAGMKLMLDLHYSDTWADPGHQRKPAAWADLMFFQLVDQVREYSSNCIASFRAAGVMPEYVQVGNEISSGMLWPDGAVGGTNDTPAQWSQFGELLKAGVEGIRDVAGPSGPKIIIHIDRGGDWAATRWFFDHLNQQGVPFDIIGESYYPFWHGPLSNLSNCLNSAANLYHKPVLVAETAFPWTNTAWSTTAAALPLSTSGQVQFVVDLAKIVERIPSNLGAGICWWGAEYMAVNGVNGAGFNSTSFFDSAGNVLPVADALGQCVVPLKLNGRFDNGTLVFNWPLSGAAASLVVAPNLLTPVAWSSVTNAVQNIGTDFAVTVPLSNGCRFYRLQ